MFALLKSTPLAHTDQCLLYTKGIQLKTIHNHVVAVFDQQKDTPCIKSQHAIS